MQPNVSQWLAEIKALKQQLEEQEGDRLQAWESAEKWRELYTTEAQQRRTEVKMAQQAIASLKAEIQQLRFFAQQPVDAAVSTAAVQQQVEALRSDVELKQKLVEVMLERLSLMEALKTEQANHAQTRKSLTTALGDAIDRLTRERSVGGGISERFPAAGGDI